MTDRSDSSTTLPHALAVMLSELKVTIERLGDRVRHLESRLDAVEREKASLAARIARLRPPSPVTSPERVTPPRPAQTTPPAAHAANPDFRSALADLRTPDGSDD
jgi:uncharacterized coiled-coil protein SlyX